MLYTLGEHRVEFRGSNHYVAPDATLIGRVVLEHEASVWFKTVIRGDNDPIVIGAGSNVQDGSVLHTDDGVPLTVGPRTSRSGTRSCCTGARSAKGRSSASRRSSSITPSSGANA